MDYSDTYKAFMGMWPKRIPHWEHWSCPDAETYLAGIDYYQHPRLCRLKMQEIYPQLGLPVPESDDPKPRPSESADAPTASVYAHGGRHVRWGDCETWEWDWGNACKTAEEVFAFSPLAHADFTDVPVVESHDYSDEEQLYQMFRKRFPQEWGDKAPEALGRID